MDAPPCPISLDPFVPPMTLRAVSNSSLLFLALHRLLAACWVESPPASLPSSPTILALAAGLTVDQWRDSGELLMGAFEKTGDRYTNPGLRAVWDQKQKRTSTYRENGAKGGRPRVHPESNGLTNRLPVAKLQRTNSKPAALQPDSNGFSSPIPPLKASASPPRSVAAKSGSPSEASERPDARAFFEATRTRHRRGAVKDLLHKRVYAWTPKGIKDRFHHRLIADILAGEPDLSLVWWLLERAEAERPRDPVGWVTGALQGTWPEPAEISPEGLKAFGAWWAKSTYAAGEAIELKRAGFNV